MPLRYPAAARGDVVDDHHGELVADPYRWLEDTDATRTRAWIAAENTLTESFLSSVASREDIRARLAELFDYPKFGVPFRHGDRSFEWRQDGLADQPVLFVLDRPGTDGRALLDANELSGDGTVAVVDIACSADGALLAYATSLGGSDWQTWHVRDVTSGDDLPDVLHWSKFTSAAWAHDGSGFYYGRLDPPAAGEELLGENHGTRIAFHRLGTAQLDDTEVWAAADEPEWLPDVEVSEDGRYLYVSVAHGTRPENQLHVLALDADDAVFVAVRADFTVSAQVVGNADTTLFVLTNADAERNRVVAIDLAGPTTGEWRTVVGEDRDMLVEAHHLGGRLVCHHLHDVASRLSVYRTDGARVGEIALAPGRHVGAISGRHDSAEMYFSTSGFTDAGTVFAHDLESDRTTVLHPPAARLDPEAFVTTQVFVTSEDGTRIPMFLTHRTDVCATGDVPTLLYGYGGFNVALTPRFSVAMALFAERGGLLATAGLRGGGEYGRAWYEAGRLAHKQNVFDDFAACARWLAASGWTRPERIAVNGGSNGGLLVGATLVQHPELIGAAVAEVGVLDLLRYHRFTIGWAWTSDYGDPDDAEEYAWVRAYSPLHNLTPGRAYPPTLLTTGDHDDRVVPGHTFKFAAALQRAQGGDAPVLVRIDTAAGHGSGKPTAKLIAERTDVLSFIEAALGVSARGGSDDGSSTSGTASEEPRRDESRATSRTR